MKSFTLIAVIMFVCSGVKAHDATVARYLFRGNHYYAELIEAALEASEKKYGAYQIKPYQDHIPVMRILKEVEAGNRLNMMWAPAFKEFSEADVKTIPIPTVKGLRGFRAIFIHEDKDLVTNKVSSISELNHWRLGQVFGWKEVDIYGHNGISITTASDVDALFAMLAAKRIDGVPIGADSAIGYHNWFVKENKLPLKIEPSTLIYYPLPIFFFVSKKTPELAERLTYGLERIIDSGKMEEIFAKNPQKKADALRIKDRNIIHIENPYLMDNIPFSRKELWLRSTMDKKK